jgi:GTP cyclohydrolase II
MNDMCIVHILSVRNSVKLSKQTIQTYIRLRDLRQRFYYVRAACFYCSVTVEESNPLPKVLDKVVGVPLNHPDFKNIMQGCFKTQRHGHKHVEQHAILYKGDISQLNEETDVLVRLNSACFTGDIMGDRSCDCTWQLFEALRMIEKSPGVGLVLYHFEHEGKGHGYFEKLKAFDGQMYPVDGDLRDFLPAVAILLHLNIHRVRLITNNPAKTEVLRRTTSKCSRLFR